jgi:hypothetical protein
MSNQTKHGLLTRIEVDYASYPMSRRVELSQNIIAHYCQLLRESTYTDDPVFIVSYDALVGCDFAWPANRFNSKGVAN